MSNKEDVEKLLSLSEDKVWVSIERTIQPDQFEPVRISMGEARTVGPDNKPDELRMQICRRLLEDVIQEGENVRANPEQYLKGEDPARVQESITETTASPLSGTFRRKRRI